MASGEFLNTFHPHDNEAPESGFATLNLRNYHPCLEFDATAVENAVFTGILPNNYSGGGLTVTIIWAAKAASSDNVRWEVLIERLEDGGTDLDTDSFASAQAALAAAPGTVGALQYTDINLSSGAQMDSLAAGEMYRIKISRTANDANDTMTGDAELYGVIVKEQ